MLAAPGARCVPRAAAGYALRPMARAAQPHRVIATNKKARHLFHILDELEVGVVLQGTEVKSLRQGRASLQEAYARFIDGELWLLGATIPEYTHGTYANHVPGRPRKLLAHRRELEKWRKQVTLRGTTIVPLELYFEGHLVKLKVGLAQGKKLHDKRESQKEKDAKRDMDRAMRRR